MVFLPTAVPCRFRANPLLHVDNWLGVETDNVVWGNYETRHYYFPVRFRAGIDRPSPDELEEIVRDGAAGAATGLDWQRFLARHADAIDVLVTYGRARGLDEAVGRFFREVDRRGEIRILHRDRSARLARGPDEAARLD